MQIPDFFISLFIFDLGRYQAKADMKAKTKIPRENSIYMRYLHQWKFTILLNNGLIIEEDWQLWLSTFLFFIYLFIRLIASVYILMIYKWSKISAWYVYSLNLNEMQPSKFIGKNRNPKFPDSALFL